MVEFAMRTSFVSVRRRLAVLPASAAVLAATLSWGAPPEKKPETPKPDAVSTSSDLPADAVDLTDKVEVTVNGALRSSSRTAHSVTLTIKNISGEDLKGPIAVIVDETGISELKLTQTDGKLSDDRGYVRIVDADSEFKAGKVLRSQKLNFETAESLKPAVRGQFDLKIRVCRVTATDIAENTDELIEGKSYSQKQLDHVMSVQEKWTFPLMEMGKGNVYGTGVSEDAEGNLTVKVYTQRSGLKEELPQTLEGIPVQIKVTGEAFSAEHPKSRLVYDNGRPKVGQGSKVQGPAPVEGRTDEDGVFHPRFSGPGGDPSIRFARPVPIGVSISNANRLFDTDPFEPSCYRGTLGCRCVDSIGNKFILTNCHVGGGLLQTPEGDPIPLGFVGGFPGEPIVQPGTGDSGCFFDTANQIGELTDIQFVGTTNLAFIPCNDDDALPLCAPINYMDAAVASVTTATTSFDTPVGGYNIPSRRQFGYPRLGARVQKYGATTIYTRGQITGLNLRIGVAYDFENDNWGYFEKQIEVTNLDGFGFFDSPGDSGSLIVTDQPGKASDREAVGLLFAGAGRVTIANPIGAIIGRFGLMVDDGDDTSNQAGISGTSGGAFAPVDPVGPLK
jgi:hypothetical protein